jgi:TolA-binding protein
MTSELDPHFIATFERKRIGLASEHELESLQRHAQECESCALQLALEGEALPRSATDRMADARAVRGVLDRLAAQKARKPRSRFLMIAAAVLIVGVAGARELLTSLGPERSAQGVDSTPAAPPGGRVEAHPPASKVPSPSVSPGPLPATSAAALPPAAQSLPAPSRPGPAETTPQYGATELFARANQLRRQKQDEAAIVAYRELQQRFAGSAEARQSRTTLGFLLLDRARSAEALAEFDRYLERPGPGTEDALAGRALSLQRLGRTAEERSALEQLLKNFPSSVSAVRARRRLLELGAPQASQ